MRRAKARLKAPFLRRLWLDDAKEEVRTGYPFTLPLFANGGFEVSFDRSITIIVGENGSGKSTLLEGIAALSGFDAAGGGPGYLTVDHSRAIERDATALRDALRASWLPRVTNGWFFRAESFFSVARYLDIAAVDSGAAPPDFLSHSHGEGFLRFFGERCVRRGLFIFDEPESALSPARQIEFLKILRDMEEMGEAQAIIATHAPILMAYPGAQLLKIDGANLAPIDFDRIDHVRVMRDFFENPERFVADALES